MLAALVSAAAGLAVGAATREGWAAAGAAAAAPFVLAMFQAARASAHCHARPSATGQTSLDEAGAWPWLRREASAHSASFDDALIGGTPAALAKLATRMEGSVELRSRSAETRKFLAGFRLLQLQLAKQKEQQQ